MANYLAVSNCSCFQPDRVTEFCKRNKLQLIIRAHECVMDGFERFAQGQLITLFSATNYCGTANNAGAILVIGRGLVVVPKLIHPLPPPVQSPETSPERALDDSWMQELNTQRPPTPTRGRPQPDHDRSSLAFIWNLVISQTFFTRIIWLFVLPARNSRLSTYTSLRWNAARVIQCLKVLDRVSLILCICNSSVRRISRFC